jgi:hexosaminidase
VKHARDVTAFTAALTVSLLGSCCTTHTAPLSELSGSQALTSSGAEASSPSATPTMVAPPGPAVNGGAIAAGLVPLPALASTDPASSFALTAATTISADPGAADVADDLAALLRPATGFPFAVTTSKSDAAPANSVALRLDAGNPVLGDEGYDLTITDSGVLLRANAAAGLFHGVQTLRQLLPASIEATSVRPRPWSLVGGHIVDYPRFAYRGAMLDVTRHFFTVAQVERYIDELALYKVNYLHLHLSDDQGWRIAIDAWPNLTAHGGSAEVGSTTRGGFYTKAEYSQIVQYAQAHFITVVPEIDTPGHVNAALSSYAELNCDGVAPPLYTGENVGFSSLCVGKPVTYTFLDAVVGELATLTPGPYIHLGGDEAHSTSPSDYVAFVSKAQAIVAAHGKSLMGWAEIAQAKLPSNSVAEYWNFSDKGVSEKNAAAQGMKVVEAPADHAYLDQKYNASTKLGLTWAGYTSVEDAYDWNPVDGEIPDSAVLGVEAPLWSETISTMPELEYLAWPRMAGIAEIGWTPQAERAWSNYAPRLALQAPRWSALGVNFYRSPEVAWAS